MISKIRYYIVDIHSSKMKQVTFVFVASCLVAAYGLYPFSGSGSGYDDYADYSSGSGSGFDYDDKFSGSGSMAVRSGSGSGFDYPSGSGSGFDYSSGSGSGSGFDYFY